MEQDLTNIGLMQLRLYARKIGVKAPTACTKPKLIEKIKEIENGKVAPYFSHRGRPRINSKRIIDEEEKHKEEYFNNLQSENNVLKDKITTMEDKNKAIENLIEDFKNKLLEIIQK